MNEYACDQSAKGLADTPRAEDQILSLEIRVKQAEERARVAEVRTANAERCLQDAEAKAEVAARRARAVATRAQAQVQVLQHQLAAVYKSTSWRITAPFRTLSMAIQPLYRAFLIGPKASPAESANPPRASLLKRRSRRPTIFVECSSTSQEELNTGIQRVVRNIVRNANIAAEKFGFDAIPVQLEHGRLIPADTLRLFADKARSAPNQTPYSWQATQSLDDYESHDRNVLLLLDASWATSDIWPAVERFKRSGGYIVGVVHDLVPLTHPHTTVETLTVIFEEWLENLLTVADSIITVSRSIKHQLEDYLQTIGWSYDEKTRIPISYFYLGSELDFIDMSKPPRQHIQEIFSSRSPTFIVVGTIEPRKNPAFILAAFDAAWQDGVDAKLIIIGRHDWKSDEFLQQVRTHPLFAKQLFLLRDVADEELDYAYRHASALVIASHIEGFGLPVAEAFQRGLPVICSDIPVFREIADGRASFFELGHPLNLTGAVKRFLEKENSDPPKKGSQQKWQTWRQSAEQLFGEIVAQIEAKRGKHTAAGGEAGARAHR